MMVKTTGNQATGLLRISVHLRLKSPSMNQSATARRHTPLASDWLRGSRPIATTTIQGLISVITLRTLPLGDVTGHIMIGSIEVR